ncbi:MAG TPA: histidinol dehydrogenase [Alphaproteobacteria bacterium]|nr:histidinol dehydrogenase [Alphaproteobacteria bacterium]MDP6269188.1 histidinol dehydrogenase [Alphaproteobacteria bacterium]MDP7426594.1 histidinol dehydrogenase [Alphaproteobacteria bacterium]HJM52318.1 histidinol dehydrogenase [Alphaproteobacteria bacterium]
MVARLDSRTADFEAQFEALMARKRAAEDDVDGVVAEIITAVRQRGDQALIEFTERFDDLLLKPETLAIDPAEIKAATAPAAQLRALEQAAERIADFHRRQMPDDQSFRDAEGVELGYRWNAIEAVGLYVPGGKAAYPSSVLMNAIPAGVAGVGRLAMMVPSPGGELNPLVLVAARLAGVDEVWRLGGAQAIAALAYGTNSLRPVDKIVGPGNAYVAAAKRQVFGLVGIDLIAGPSEILVVADGANDPAWIAADLLSQAEHDELAQAVLISDDADFAQAVVEAVEGHLVTLSRPAVARQSWHDLGAVIVVPSLDQAPALIDAMAPEHLQLALDEPEALFDRVRHAGAVFLGRHTPEAVGDYVAGPSHVLPTSGSARFSSGLSVFDFLKRTTIMRCGPAQLAAIGPAAVTLAEAEGLPAHALSVALRLADGQDGEDG